MPQRKRRHFTPEQKADAIRLVHEVGSVPQVAKDLDLTESALREWMKKAEAAEEASSPEGALSADEKKELAKLRRENRTLRMERDFLKKAAAFFAKENDRPSS